MRLKVALVLCLFSKLLLAQTGNLLPLPTQFVFIDSINISGNKVTKEHVFLNEYTVQSGDSIQYKEVAQNLLLIKQNLLNTSLFNFVWISSRLTSENHLIIDISVQERWYWWVMPILEHADRNFSAFLEDGDWSRIRYGAYVQNNNFMGRKKLLRIRFKFGYQNVLSLTYQSPQYKHKTGWGVGADFIAQDQIQSTTAYNKPVNNTLVGEAAYKKVDGKIFFNYRHNLYYRHQISLIFNHIVVSDSVVSTNPYYLYNGQNSIKYLEFIYNLSKDTRDSKVYPLAGSYYGLDLSLLGSGIWEKNMNYGFVALHLKQFAPLGMRFNVGSELDGFYSIVNKLPNFLYYGLGYQDFINGYQYNVIDGSAYFTSQNRLMYNLIPTKTFDMKFIGLSQFSKVHYAFYLKTFFDFGYVYNKYPYQTNTLTNSLIGSVGVGLDLVTYYDKVFGISYSINRSGHAGLYFHINLKL